MATAAAKSGSSFGIGVGDIQAKGLKVSLIIFHKFGGYSKTIIILLLSD